MTSAAASPQPPAEFLFGSLSTLEGRARRARSERFGFYHIPGLEPLVPRPGQPVTITARAGAGLAVESAALSYTTDGAPPDAQAGSAVSVPMQRRRIDWDTLLWSYLEEWTAVIPGQPGGTGIRYVISAVTRGGQRIFSPYFDLSAPEFAGDPAAFDLHFFDRLTRGGAPHVYEFLVDEEVTPGWLREAVIYQVFVDRFAPDPGRAFNEPDDRAGFYGGTLRGILSRLDYLSDLGVNCLWLTPIFPSPSHHGYDPTDYATIEPRLGAGADFDRLIQAAHGAGIRIILDFVAHHMSSDHPAFVQARQDPASPTRDWFFFREYPDRYVSFYDVPTQPALNSDHPAVREYLIGCACDWLRRGVDGFRLDHAHGVTHAFWSAFRAATRAVRPDSVTLGEVTDTPATTRSYAGRMDGCLDFALLELLRPFFVFGQPAPSQLDRALGQHFAYFGDSLVLPSFLDNHDMNRFLWVVGGDRRRLRLAALAQFTLPGPPVVYYGTEVGLSQIEPVGRLEESRLPMIWGDEQDRSLLEFYKSLIAFRRQTAADWSLPRRTLVVDDARGVYAYACGAYAVILNNSLDTAAVRIEQGWKANLVLSTEASVLLQRDQVRLPPFAGAICRLASE